MSDRRQLIFYDIIMIIGVILVVSGGFFIYDSEIGLTEGSDSRQDINREVYLANAGYSLEIPEMEVERVEPGIVELEIPPGTTVWETAALFEEKGLMAAGDFLWLVQELELGKRIRAGSYKLSNEMEIREIFERIFIPKTGGEVSD